MTTGPIGFTGTGRMGTPMRGFERLAEEVGYEPRVTAAALRGFRKTMTRTLVPSDHVEVVELIAYSEGGRS